MNILRPIALGVGLTALPLAIFAHFKLLEPAEWVKTNDLGDPQKPGPCGLTDTNGDKREAADELLDQGHRRIEISLEDSGNGLPLGSLPRSSGREFTK